MNAYVSGLGPTKRVVISKSCLKELTVKEIQSVICKELGHVVHHHRAITIFLRLLYVCILVLLIDYCYGIEGIALDFGFKDVSIPVYMFISGAFI